MRVAFWYVVITMQELVFDTRTPTKGDYIELVVGLAVLGAVTALITLGAVLNWTQILEAF